MAGLSIGDGEGAFARGTLGLVVLEACGRLVRANPAFSSMAGRDPSLEPGLALPDILEDGVDLPALLAVLRRFGAERGVIPSRAVPYVRRLADGTYERRSAEISLVDWCDAGPGDAPRLTLSFADITEGGASDARLDAQMRLARTRYKDIYENIAEGVYRCSLDGVPLSANPALVHLKGYDSEAELLHAVSAMNGGWYVDPGRRETFLEILHTQGVVRDFVAEIYRHGTGERIWVSENARIVHDPASGEPLFYEGSVRDVTATIELLREKAKLDKIAAQAPGCLFELRLGEDRTRAVSYASAGIETLVGITAEEMVADLANFERRVHPEDREPLIRTIEDSAASRQPWRTEFRMRRTDGTDVWIASHALPEDDGAGAVVWHGFLSDITQAHAARERMHNLAFTDALTGLPNRQMLRDRARQELAASDRTGEWGAILFIDLDGFKQLNDSQGHDAGDQLLIGIARRLEGCLRANDVVARIGGDEFVVLLTHLSRDPGEAVHRADAVAEKVRQTIDQPYTLGSNAFQTTSSVGMELFQGRTIDFDALLKRADTAMYRAKSSGRNRVFRYDPAMQAGPRTDPTDSADVRQAIEEGLLDLYVQPIVDPSGDVRGGEALLRWIHPERGPTPPLPLLEKAEAMGLSGRLHHWVLNRACEMLADWRADPALDGLTLSMNVAPEQIQGAGFSRELTDVLAACGAPADRLVLEVTEHAMLKDVDGVAAAMVQLKRQGLRFSLDDFGTGYASLTYLKHLPLNELKIDRSFVKDITEDGEAHVIVATTILAARQLGLSITAEGVETAEQARALAELGVDRLQGYLFARPMPDAEFRRYVASSRLAEPLRQAG